MLSRVLRTITRHRLLGDSGARRVLCAVSGGPDSMAMLACLWELVDRLRLTLEVATVDHGMRPAAEGEIALVAERAAALGLPFHVRRVDVAGARGNADLGSRGAGPRPGRGVQEVARRLRLAALTELAAERGLDRVALAHQADDQAETVLFRILRGTGVAGLAGIPYVRLPFVRPLLDVSRAEIQVYLRRRSIPFATDPSNADLRYARARIRHQVLPALRRENPRLDESLRRLAAEAAQGAAIAGLPGVHVSGRVAAQIDAAAGDGRGTRSFDVAGGRVRVSYGRVHLEAKGNVSDSGSGIEEGGQGDPAPPSITITLTITQPGSYQLGPMGSLVVQELGHCPPAAGAVTALPGAPQAHADTVTWSWFDGDGLGWPLRVRAARPGDRMFPRGSTGRRKLSDLLIDAKVPRFERPSLPVVTDDDGTILFVPGLRPAQRGTPILDTRRHIGLAVVPFSDHDASVDPSIVSGNTQRYRDPKGLS